TVAASIATFLGQCKSAGLFTQEVQTPPLPPPGPLFVWHSNLAPGRPAPKRALVQFHAIGTERALAEAVVIRALSALVADLYQVESVVAPEPLPAAPTQKTRFMFIHIGNEAKRISLTLAEDFRKAHVPLTQDIGVESLIEQMRYVEKRNPPYILVMGRKEALE